MTKIVSFFFLILLLAACSTEPEVSGGGNNTPPSGGNNGNGNGNNTEEPSKPYFTFPENLTDTLSTVYGVIYRYNYDTNMENVTATSSESWCTAVAEHGALEIKLMEYYSRTTEQWQNDTYPEPRMCEVTITAGDSYSKKIIVVQESYDAVIYTSQYYGAIKVSPAGDKVVKYITSNCISWSATTDADWVKLKKLNKDKLEITTSPRPDDITTPRTATIKLTSDVNYRISTTITLEELDAEISAGEYDYDDTTPWD